MRRNNGVAAWVVAVMVAVVALLGSPAAAHAEDAPADPGAKAAAQVLCRPLGFAPGWVQGTCTDAVAGVWSATVSVDTVCMVALGPASLALKGRCVDAVTPLMEQAKAAAASAAAAAGAVVDTAVKAAKFVANPAGVVDEWANAAAASASDLIGRVMVAASTSTAPDLTATWFRDLYAKALALGVVLLAVMLLLLSWDVARGRVEAAEWGHALMTLPGVGVAMMFTPAVGAVIVGATEQLAQVTARVAATQMGSFDVTATGWWAQLMTATAGTVPGGALVGLIVFILQVIGALSTLAGMILQKVGVYGVVVALGLGWGMWIHPRYRAKVRALWVLVVGLLLQKPIFFLLLAAAFAIMNNAFSGGVGTDPIGLLTGLMTVTVVLLTVGLAPWGLMRYASRLMPSGSETAQHGGGGHMSQSLLAGAAGGMSSVMAQRAYGMSMGGGPAGGSTGGGSTAGAGSGPGSSGGGAASSGGGVSPSWQARATGSVASPPAGAAAGSSGAAAAGGGAAAGAGRAAGTAAAGAATAGVAVGAQMAASAAQAGMQRARQLANEVTAEAGSGEEGR